MTLLLFFRNHRTSRTPPAPVYGPVIRGVRATLTPANIRSATLLPTTPQATLS